MPNIEHAFAQGVEHFTCFGESNASARAAEQFGTDGLFKVGQLDGRGRLAEKQFLCRQADIAQPSHFLKSDQLFDVGRFGKRHTGI